MLVVPQSELEALRSDIRELHARANERRAALGHPAAQDVEPMLLRHGGVMKPSPSSSPLRMTSHSLNTLSLLRDQKASELQLLSLRKVGRSTGAVVKAADQPKSSLPGSRFNARALITTVDALIEQHDEIEQQVCTRARPSRAHTQAPRTTLPFHYGHLCRSARPPKRLRHPLSFPPPR
jgi:hypothetical protein